MKNLLLLLFIIFLSCSTDSEQLGGCECEKLVYKNEIVSMSGVNPIWGYNYQYTEQDSTLDCEDATDEYMFMGNNLYYKVVCE